MIIAETGEPRQEGTYCCEVYFGWKLLEWKNGAWRVQGGIARWAAEAPKQWIGPLPELVRETPPVRKLEFDL